MDRGGLRRLGMAGALAVACGGPDPQPPRGADPKEATAAVVRRPRATEPVARAEQLWSEISGVYPEWTAATAAPTGGTKGHSALTRIFYNATAQDALTTDGDWPDGTVFVKENYAWGGVGGGVGALENTAVMSKDGDRWFWARYQPDGSIDTTPEDGRHPDRLAAGPDVFKCVACHKVRGQRDSVIITAFR